MWQKYKPYIISVLIALGVGALSALFTMGNMSIYQSINTPPLSPPGWLFPVVWAILYILMGISSAIIYEKGKGKNTESLKVYALQLVVNFFWSIIFFNLRTYLFAFIWLLILLYLIGVMIYRFYQIDPLAAYLQIPYFLWVTFAGYLNFMIFILNM